MALWFELFLGKEQTFKPEMIYADLWSCVFNFVKEKQTRKCVTFSSNLHETSVYSLTSCIPDSAYPGAPAIWRVHSMCQQPKQKQGWGKDSSLHARLGRAFPNTNPIHHLPDAISYQQFCCLFNASVCLSILKYHLLVLLSHTAHVHSQYTSKVTNEQSS